MFILQGVSFPLRTDERGSAFYVHGSDDGDTIDISVDAHFQENTFEGDDNVEPYVSINPIQTNKNSLSDLIGMSFEVKTIEEADEREDTLYIWEHEPFENYLLNIVDIKDDKVHIQCKGTAVTDGYAEPYKTVEFTMDCWLPIITGVDDWKKYGL
ncbi:hypothetical protein [Paenibacillus sp. GCM10027626]|uniref:hypothetical protein n=1 Tax=Paenibacillus sp. GCM10027626 TaxID=3273411 RepID=UPI003637DFB2